MLSVSARDCKMRLQKKAAYLISALAGASVCFPSDQIGDAEEQDGCFESHWNITWDDKT